MKSYSELIKKASFSERLEYLRLFSANKGNENRKLMNAFYKSDIWKKTRENIIIRDWGCDLGISGLSIADDTILVHHINPITEEDVLNHSDKLLDPENLITVSLKTHNLIHYNLKDDGPSPERKPGDTKLW